MRQPGIVFGINDSGHEPLLFALDTLGEDRGTWSIRGATNRDWEAASAGPCGRSPDGGASADPRTPRQATSAPGCLYIGDVGDNGASRRSVTLYRVSEPEARHGGLGPSLHAERVAVRYPDGAHDVEAMYVAPNGDTFLITKRPLARGDVNRTLRPALVYGVWASAWGSRDVVTAELADSLPIVPGSAKGRLITDAALSADGHRLAVRTYAEVWIFPTDSATGRVIAGEPTWACPVSRLRERQGEGVAWLGSTLILTSEGRDAPMFEIRCLPRDS